MNNIYINESALKDCFIDTTKVKKIYVGTTLVWQNETVEQPVSIAFKQLIEKNIKK